MSIIGISGKIGSGKDTVGSIIQYLTQCKQYDLDYSYQEFLDDIEVDKLNNRKSTQFGDFEIHKFADKLKDIVCLLISCTREQLEDREFKEKELGEEWTQYAYAIGHRDTYLNGKTSKEMISKFCTKEVYEYEKAVNWQTAYKQEMTPRLLLQLIGTELGRNIIHPNLWILSLFSNYVGKSIGINKFGVQTIVYPKWIITDTRFPNELEAIKARNGITIRVNRLICSNCGNIENFHIDTNLCNECGAFPNTHESETALDNAKFDYTIENDGTLLDLVSNVKVILQKENII